MQQPLVSIIVPTYNSGKFVIETLESAKAQTWQHLELIVSDDCSTDNTIELCQNWIAANKDRFVRTDIITVPENTGVSANCNRCIEASNAEWIKIIAGDDILFSNCIKDNMDFAEKNTSATIIFSQVIIYHDNFKEDNQVAAVPHQYPMNLMNPAYSVEEQNKLLLMSDRINYTPSYFFKKQTLIDIGGYDEENKLVEDYPMWLKLTRAGYRLFYFHIATVGYRRHENALNNMKEEGLFKPLLLKSAPLRKAYVYPYLPWDIACSEKHVLNVSKLFQQAGLNKNTTACRLLYGISTTWLNPFRYIIYFKKKILKLGRNNVFYADR